MSTVPVTPSPTRRTTRSSAASPPLKSPLHPLPPLTPSLLLPPSPPTPLPSLLSSLPGRHTQILDLLRLIGPANSPIPPLLLYGSPATGKTSSLLCTFRHLRRPFVYASCRSCYSPRLFFESILNQLLLRRRSPDNGYSSAKRCDRGSDFVNLLKDASCQAVAGIKKGGDGEMVYLLFDNLELARSWEKGDAFLSLIFRLYDIMKMPELGLVYISSSTPDSYYGRMGSVEPMTVYFPDYTVDELHSIFMRNQDNPKLYSSFLSAVLKPFFRITRRVDELSIAFKPLFKKYCEPLTDPSTVPDEGMKRRLFDNLQSHLAVSFNEIFSVPSHSRNESGGTQSKKGRRLEASNELEFHMSVSAKYLLISAFLASRNPATLDTALFDSTGGSNKQKRKRKSSQTSIDQKEDAAQELLLKGPGSFPLERLVAIFQCITSVDESVLEQESPENGDNELMSDVLLQLSTLCNANFICKSASCPLEGATRYRSTVDEEMALKVARSVNFPLSKYLYRR